MVNYNDKIFRPIGNTENGETSNETKFHYKQVGNILSSEYSGGKILTGHLISLVDKDGLNVSSNSIIKKKTVLFFYTKEALTHLAAAHKKALAFKSKNTDYQFIAINLDKDQKEWLELLSNYKFDGIQEYRCANFEDIKNKWAITKIHRALVLDENGKIKNAFTNLFDVKFEKELN